MKENRRLKIVNNLIECLNKEDVVYCHWKSNEHLIEAFNGVGDIDMLVSERDVPTLNKILSEVGFKRFIIPIKRSYMAIEDFLGYDSETCIIVHLHLHYKFTLGEKHLKSYQIPFENLVLKNRIYDKEFNIYTSSFEDEMWLLLIRIAMKFRHRDYLKLLIGKKIIDESTQKEYTWLLERLKTVQFSTYVQNLLGSQIQKSMDDIIETGFSLSNILKLRKYVHKRFKFYRTYNSTNSLIRRWIREGFRVIHILNNVIFKRPIIFRRRSVTGGKIVSLLGPDGSGKSTVINEVYKHLKPYMDIHKEYLGSGDGNSSFFRKPFRVLYAYFIKKGMLNPKRKILTESNINRYEGETKTGEILRSIGHVPWLITLSYERRIKLIRARKFRNKGFLVITDRYPQSQHVNICDGPKIDPFDKNLSTTDRVLRWFEHKSFSIAEISKPDLIVILKVTPEMASQRKPDEIQFDTHKKLMETLLGLNFGIQTESKVINANQPIEEVLKEVLSAIWRVL